MTTEEPKERTYNPERKALAAGPAAIGCISDDPIVDPEADASVLSVLKGMFAEMQKQTALLATIAANTAPVVLDVTEITGDVEVGPAIT